jgi:integrase
LHLSHLRLEGQASVQIPARPAAQARRIRLPDWSVPVLSEWHAQRSRLPVFNDMLFPGRRRSRTVALHGGEPADRCISSSELYETIRPAMQAAGFDDEQQGPQTLRNTFAMRQLVAGVAAADLQAWLGLRTRFSIDAIQRELDASGPGAGPQPV